MKKTIWICDDDEEILQVCSLILKKKNYEVLTFTTCESVFPYLETQKPDVILMDLWIPEMGGESCTLKLKNDLKTKHIPVILFSAHNELEKVSLKVKAEGFLKKPFEIAQLMQVINRHTV